MKCPVCGDPGTRVIDSRAIKDGSEIRRRRLCDACAHRYTTYERAERAYPAVVKKDGRRETWDREKILRGVSRACEKRPVSIEQLEKLVDDIGISVGSLGDPEVPAKIIGEQIMSQLKQLDEVAYVRFASVYRSFKDIDEFMAELSTLVGKRKPEGERP